MRRSVAISLLTAALVGIASAAGYNAYAAYVIGRTIRRAMETDAAQTQAVLELGTAADAATYAETLRVCRESVQTRILLRRQIAAIDPADFELVQVRVLRLFEIEDRVVEEKRHFIQSQMALHCAEERLKSIMPTGAASGPQKETPAALSEARSVVLSEAQRAVAAARSYLAAYVEALIFSGELRKLADTAGLTFPDIYGSLEQANRQQVRDILDVAGFAAPSPARARTTDLPPPSSPDLAGN